MSKLYVVGIGPGGYEQMTVKAVKVLEECDIIVGYTVYVDLVAEHEISRDYPGIEIEIVSGVTAALSGGAVLGAPLMHDFAVISLSDLMTPWMLIEKRLAAAASADMAICLYNPSSKKRRDYLNKACRIVMQSALPETVCGIVKQIGREGESCQVMTLQELSNYEADMFTTVFIGNSTTKVINGKMVTPRGYKLSE